MAIFAAALCGLCSQWESEEKTILPQVIKLIQETMIVALYFWTLIAPTCCPERDFDY